MPKKQLVEIPGQQGRSFSQGLIVGDLVFVGGQVPKDLVTRQVQGTTIEEQTKSVLERVRTVLEAAGCNMNDCVKITTHLASMDDYAKFEGIYKTYFDPPYPTRITLQSTMSPGFLIAMEAIAVKGAGGK